MYYEIIIIIRNLKVKMLYKCIIKEKYIQLFEFVKPKLLKFTCLVNILFIYIIYILIIYKGIENRI